MAGKISAVRKPNPVTLARVLPVPMEGMKMSNKFSLNIALVSAFALLVGCSEPANVESSAKETPTATAPIDQTPQILAFLEETYSYFEQDGASPPDRNHVFDNSMLALMVADEEATPEGDMGTLDSDPLCSCQDYSIGKTVFQISEVTNNSAKAHVKLIDSEVSLDLVKQGDDWRIHDVNSNDYSIRQAFIEAASSRTK